MARIVVYILSAHVLCEIYIDENGWFAGSADNDDDISVSVVGGELNRALGTEYIIYPCLARTVLLQLTNEIKCRPLKSVNPQTVTLNNNYSHPLEVVSRYCDFKWVKTPHI